MWAKIIATSTEISFISWIVRGPNKSNQKGVKRQLPKPKKAISFSKKFCFIRLCPWKAQKWEAGELASVFLVLLSGNRSVYLCDGKGK